MKRLLSQRVEIKTSAKGAAAHCRECGHDLGPASRPWKQGAALRERPLRETAEIYTTDKRLLLREFACPGCGGLLDTEIALPDDPFLNDSLGGE
jgi:acetone carboxylase gamma subunit